MQLQPPRFQDVVYPPAAQAIGWVALVIPILPIPAFAIHILVSKSREASARHVAVAPAAQTPPTTSTERENTQNALGLCNESGVEPSAPLATGREDSDHRCVTCPILRNRPVWMKQLVQVSLNTLCAEVLYIVFVHVRVQYSTLYIQVLCCTYCSASD